MERRICSKMHSPSLAFTLCFPLLFLKLPSRMTLLALLFFWLKKKYFNKNTAFMSGHIEKPNDSIHRDTPPSIWAARDHLGFPSPVYLNLHICFFHLSQTIQHKWALKCSLRVARYYRKRQKRMTKTRALYRDCRYFSFMKGTHHLNTSALWKAAAL